jgi:N,N-dimethylformamidase beta subunit-like, C-terminal
MTDEEADGLTENTRRYPPGPGDPPVRTPSADGREDPDLGQEGLLSRSARQLERERMDRRRFLGWSALGGLVVVGAAVGYEESKGDAKPGTRSPAASRARATSRKGRAQTTGLTTLSNGVVVPTSDAIKAENARTGNAWWVTSQQKDRAIEGFASQVSAVAGDRVALYVNTTASSFHVEAYRMGYYQGIGGRLVWRSAEVRGVQQPDPVLSAPTNTIECQWSPSLSFTVASSWPPGAYLLKLVGATGEQQFVPLCVRDDSSTAAIVIQSSVTTWQAYNRWGGYSLYYGNADGAFSYIHAPGNGSYDHRSRIVSFDRPYDFDWANGAADFVGNEFPVVYHAEQLGLDVTYWTDIDLHLNPQLVTNHKAVFSLGHDEYWSTPMRNGADTALAAGTNFAFLGANACYRQVRFQSSSVGPNRQQICYKDATEDPLTGVNDALVTVNWPQSPVDRPEAQLIGSTYQDVEANADGVVADPTHWVLDGTGLGARAHLPQLVQGEFDRYVPGGSGPSNVDVVAHSVIPNRGGNYSDVTWYTASNGGGVFATGNASWVNKLSHSTLVPGNTVPDAIPGVTAPLLRIMENLYSVLGRGPAGVTHPSQGNWSAVYAGSSGPNAPSADNTA